MRDDGKPLTGDFRPTLVRGLSIFAVAGCVILSLSILVADFVVPDHDWIADTISDLGAGDYEFIVDIGLYTFSAALIALAVLAAHVHLGDWDWSAGILGLIAMALLVFLIGARNEYGDADQDGVVIHVYLVYGLGAVMAATPLLLAQGAARVSRIYPWLLRATAVVWILAAPLFFFLPTAIDGVYERLLGLISFVMVCLMAHLFFAVTRKV
ncbi:DUF998 domain-containing protein [Gymnodinialimonas hymeniacidonis]|uniref:DUF998 domain-containing protein n=1 Tax=Gymnodinialimonas hymeniacidonis TaxID=3126508 RepID=UPI0034C6C21A